ncbi:hypothetical protein [Bradyrhizobium sp. McL0616]|uniref:hypothetical protein n=1 Tax=Bradyrhizobium sp. McL0616 TaxID=3415674 RepID=UPI003CE6A9D5
MLGRFVEWLRPTKGVAAWFGLSVLILLVSYFFPEFLFSRSGTDRIKWAGLLFQILGLAVVISGFDEARAAFGGGRFFNAVNDWLERLPSVFRRPPALNLTLNAGTGSIVSVGRAIVRATSSDIQEQLKRLQEQIEQLETRVEQQLKSEADRVNKLIQSERSEREAADSVIREGLTHAMVGNVNLQLGGAAWLFVGIVLTSIPEDIEKFFHTVFRVST